MITLVLHDHMTDIKKLLQQKVALKKFFSLNSLLNSPSTPPSTFQTVFTSKTPSTGFGLKEERVLIDFNRYCAT
ncbi:unnamed protein product [Rhizophagus irregularis]|nr:unnamed protein product [Rhizophagus irregularis]